eukprot:Lithocolla_globosa_v1_NODE_6_length_11976_cov_15.425432.p6 type:complete len:235 gc:universal NODE_6_length_11976_cov_15.425432:10399-9695(-)
MPRTNRFMYTGKRTPIQVSACINKLSHQWRDNVLEMRRAIDLADLEKRTKDKFSPLEPTPGSAPVDLDEYIYAPSSAVAVVVKPLPPPAAGPSSPNEEVAALRAEMLSDQKRYNHSLSVLSADVHGLKVSRGETNARVNFHTGDIEQINADVQRLRGQVAEMALRCVNSHRLTTALTNTVVAFAKANIADVQGLAGLLNAAEASSKSYEADLALYKQVRQDLAENLAMETAPLE